MNELPLHSLYLPPARITYVISIGTTGTTKVVCMATRGGYQLLPGKHEDTWLISRLFYVQTLGYLSDVSFIF